jgi:uncharacterized protein (DUF1697 family)
MLKRIAILRGINVGGKRKVVMEDLKLLFSELGFKNISTYIQSGNVLFGSDVKQTDIEIAELIEQAILREYKFEVPVIVRVREELELAIKNNPFYQSNETDLNQLYLTFLKEVPVQENLVKVESTNFEPDKFKISGKDVFVFCKGKYHQTKLNNNFFENKLKTPATTRNWKTVLKLVELSK